MNYNKKRYLEILKVNDSRDLNIKEIRELSNYSGILNAYLDFETRHDYLQLLKEINDGKIDSIIFSSKFIERTNLNENVLKTLEENFLILSPDKKLLEKSLAFSHFIEEILGYCYLQYEGCEIDIKKFNSPLLEAEYQASMKNIYNNVLMFLARMDKKKMN